MQTLLLLTILLITLPFAWSLCGATCLSCVDPNGSSTARNQCTSCTASYFLQASQCLLCELCANYGACSICYPQNQTNSSSNKPSASTLAIVFGVIGGIFLISFLGIVIYRKCSKSNASSQQPLGSQNQLLIVAQQLKWSQGVSVVGGTESCAICLQQGTFLQTSCGHMYHSECLYAWATKREANCPLCKSATLQPLKMYCEKCLLNYVQASIVCIPQIRSNQKWKNCQNCTTALIQLLSQ